MKTAVALVATVVLAVPLAAQAPPAGGGTLASQQAALRVLSRATDAHGGLARMDVPGFARARYRIVPYMPGQEVGPADTVPVRSFQPPLFVTVTSDAAQRTLVAEIFLSDTASQPVQRIVSTSEDRFAFRIPGKLLM